MSAAPLGRAARWVWCSPAPLASLARGALLLFAGAFRASVAVRNAAYDGGLLPVRRLPLPSLGIGNLEVGGTGKTPLASWVAAELRRRGARPGIILRGYGGDEAAEHAAALPEAVVEADPDRVAASARAARSGASVLVLDDCLQRRAVRVDAMLAVVSADTWGRPPRRWPLPAGPWREGLGALGRCDLVVVTCKAAEAEAASTLAAELAPRTRGRSGVVADLALSALVPLAGGPGRAPRSLRGLRVLAVCGIGEPEAFRAQLERTGASVRLQAFGDHHAYVAGDLAQIGGSAAGCDFVVTTGKDAVKLRGRWPPQAPPCLVAVLEVQITCGAGELGALLDRVATAARRTPSEAAAASPESES